VGELDGKWEEGGGRGITKDSGAEEGK